MAPLIAAIVSILAKNGLGLLAGAVQAKGKEFVEKKLGIELKPDMTAEELLKVKQAELDNEADLRAWQIENRKLDNGAEKVAQDNVTKRWEADLHSDNKLSKNIRPGTLVYLLVAVSLFAMLDSIPGLGFEVKEVWVKLLSGALELVLLAYFAGRSIEKGVNMWSAKK
jgi:hypothetical protein